MFKGKKPNDLYFRAFGSNCFIYNNGKLNLGKFDPRSDKDIFFGCSSISEAYHVYNKCIQVIEEYIHVVFHETNDGLANSSSFYEFQLSR